MRKLNIYHLPKKVTGITKKVGDFLAEAAQVCLELQGHKSGVIIEVSGLYIEQIELEWQNTIDEETLLSWKDIKETTEYGATAIALLLTLYFTGYNYCERLPQGYLGDYFLKKLPSGQEKKKEELYLEISGIFKESKTNTLKIRINQKKKQIANKYPAIDLNILIAVIEFNEPKAKIIKA